MYLPLGNCLVGSQMRFHFFGYAYFLLRFVHYFFLLSLLVAVLCCRLDVVVQNEHRLAFAMRYNRHTNTSSR